MKKNKMKTERRSMKNTERQSPGAPDVSRFHATWVFLGDEDAAGRTCPHSLSMLISPSSCS